MLFDDTINDKMVIKLYSLCYCSVAVTVHSWNTERLTYICPLVTNTI